MYRTWNLSNLTMASCVTLCKIKRTSRWTPADARNPRRGEEDWNEKWYPQLVICNRVATPPQQAHYLMNISTWNTECVEFQGKKMKISCEFQHVSSQNLYLQEFVLQINPNRAHVGSQIANWRTTFTSFRKQRRRASHLLHFYRQTRDMIRTFTVRKGR